MTKFRAIYFIKMRIFPHEENGFQKQPQTKQVILKNYNKKKS